MLEIVGNFRLYGLMINMFKKTLILVLLSLGLMACGDKTETESLAQEQINEYSKKLEDCKEDAAKESEIKKETIGAEKEEAAKHVRGYTIEPDDIVFGNQEASVVLVEYFSPTCPHCVSYHKRTYPEIQKKYIDTGKIAYVMREFIGNKQDLDATILARCVGDIDNYIKFMHVILEQQDNWAFSKNYREVLTNIAGLGGVSPEKYAACLNDEFMLAILMENTKLVAKEPRFIGTPSFFINGKQFINPYTLEELSKAIDVALDGS